jgi:hypothetical protein
MITRPDRQPDRINERGNYIYDNFCHADRYKYDFHLCKRSDGWIQYDTTQDAWYFGVWVNEKKRLVVTYAEGDVSICYCLTTQSFKEELKAMAEFYGDPPPAAIGIDRDGSVTHFFDPDARPEI